MGAGGREAFGRSEEILTLRVAPLLRLQPPCPRPPCRTAASAAIPTTTSFGRSEPIVTARAWLILEPAPVRPAIFPARSIAA